MDPISLLQLLQALQSFDKQSSHTPTDGRAGSITQPAKIDTAALQASFADLTRGILKCYHPSGRYQLADIVQKPWERQDQYRADDSALVRINFFGAISAKPYEMTVAILSKNDPTQIRTAVLTDNAPLPANSACALDRWTVLNASGKAEPASSSEAKNEESKFPMSIAVKNLEFVISQEQSAVDTADKTYRAHVSVSRDSEPLIDEVFDISGALQDAWITDLDGDGNPEVVLWNSEDGSGAYGELSLYEFQDNSLIAHKFPDLTDDQSKRFRYRGHDTLRTSASSVVRRFPSYQKNDANCCPSGPNVEVTYKYRAKNLSIEAIRQIPSR